jgi:hypothetical protein
VKAIRPLPFISPGPATSEACSARQDVLTLSSIAVVAYTVADVLHEGLGHGGACLLSACRPVLLTAVSFQGTLDSRFISAGGSIVNAIAGAVFFVFGRMFRHASPRARFFLWLAMTINLLQPAGYLLFSGTANIGDWADVIRGLQPAWVWRLGLALTGALAYWLVVWLALLEMRPLIGSESKARVRAAWRFTLIPYFTGAVLYCIAGSLNPSGMILVGISAAAASLGGTSGLAWMASTLRGNWIPGGNYGSPVLVARSWAWIAFAAAVAAAFISVLGPGVKLGS